MPKEKPKKYMTTLSLDHVIQAEANTIRNRSACASKNLKRGDGLPNIDGQTSTHTLSDTFRSVWSEINTPEQNDRWKNRAQKTNRHDGLIGLAFSGGGIRSATFGLGVLLALIKLKLFHYVDYLSTVSGGGYLGSWWSSLNTSSGSNSLLRDQHQQEDSAVRYLRNNAKYIAPNGLLDILRIPAVLFRGALINLIAIMPYLLLAALATYFIDVKNDATDCAGLTEKIYSGIIELAEGENMLRAFTIDCKFQFSNIDPVILNVALPDFSFINAPFFYTTLVALALSAYVVIFPISNMVFEHTQKFKNNAWVFRKKFDRNIVIYLIVLCIIFFMELQPLAISFLKSLEMNWDLPTIGGYTGLYTIISASFVSGIRDRISKLSTQMAILLLGLFTFLAVWFLYLSLSLWVIDGYKPSELNTRLIWLISVISLTTIYSLLFININITSLHNFYRDVLSRAYLVRRDDANDRQLNHNDSQKLSQLNTNTGPYHLINASLNMTEATEQYHSERQADFFIFSKYYIGSVSTGYQPTETLEQISDHINLGTAMAISGAAASPAMGKFSKQSIAFLLALFNIRLNYWFPNPSRLFIKKHRNGILSRLRYRATSWYLIPELFGLLNYKSKLVNLSDGGHLENMGVYELLRRQCRLIILSDGECDSELRFQGFLEVVRMAQVDLSITITIEGLDKLREGQQHYAIGTIDYGEGCIGKIIYLKLSLLKKKKDKSAIELDTHAEALNGCSFDKNSYLAYYKSQNPSFPHETTSDQFFDESQFECYRALGYQVAMSTLGKEK